MARTHSPLSRILLIRLAERPLDQGQLFGVVGGEYSRKAVYDTLFRLMAQGLVEREAKGGSGGLVRLTEDGQNIVYRVNPQRDGVWKMVIFDIPERKRAVRNLLRSKLKTLGFKKWQASIWVSPFSLDPVIEDEFKALAEKYFIRLIKTTDINHAKDLEELFE